MGSDILVYGRADAPAGQISLQLAMVELSTSRTESFSKSVPSDQLPAALSEAASAILRFAKLTDAQIAEAGLNPPPSEWPSAAGLSAAVAVGDEPRGADAVRAALASGGADSPWLHYQLLYSAAPDEGLELANEALKRWPEDPRLLGAKMDLLLRRNSWYAAALMGSECVRRQPDNIMAAAQFRLTMREAPSDENEPPAVGVAWQSLLRITDRLLAVYPDNWALRWDRAVCSGHVFERRNLLAAADLLNGAGDLAKLKREDIQKALAAKTKEHGHLAERTLADLRQALERRPDCPQLIVSLLYWHGQLTDGKGEDAPDKALQWQYPLLARLNLLDPANIDGDLAVADAQIGAPESVQLKILRDLAKRRNNEPQVMGRIASNLVRSMRKRMNWDMYSDKQSENAKRLADAPEAEFFVEAIRAAVNADLYIYPGQTDILYHLAKANPAYADLHGTLIYPYMNRHYKAANEAQKKGDFQTCYDHASRVVDLQSGADMEPMLYCVVKSLWKLDRLDEAMAQAERGIRVLPKKHTFHYLFAVIALQQNKRLEEALEHAKIAAQLDPKNAGIHETVEKLAKKLGKPTK